MTAEVQEKKVQVLPIYLMIDVSFSMEGEPLRQAQQAVEQILFEVKLIPSLAECAYIAVMSFSGNVRRLMRLANLSYVDTAPTLQLGTHTSYVTAIDALVDDVAADVAKLKRENKAVFRPCVFFITDGDPTDSDSRLDAAIERLTGTDPVPNVIPIGVGDASDDKLKRLATNGYPAWKASGDVGPAMAEVAKALVRSVVASVRNSQRDVGDEAAFVFDMSPMMDSPNIKPIVDFV